MRDIAAGIIRSVLNIFRRTEDAAGSAVHEMAAVVHAVEHVVEESEKETLNLTRKFINAARRFLKMSAAGGIVLMIVSVLALIVSNSFLAEFYHFFLNDLHFAIGFSDPDGRFDMELQKSLLHWINDGLMAVFFFLIGLEVKREFSADGLAGAQYMILPSFAAIGGVAVPALIFWGINHDNPAALSGWAIPAATDIAFALAVLSFLGDRVPTRLKAFLATIAVVDDLAAIMIIALFYGKAISLTPLYFAGAALFMLFVINRRNVTALTPYILLTIVLWVAVLESGVHATLAGFLAALFVPMRDKHNAENSPGEVMERHMQPYVAFLVLPAFGFANAGVNLSGLTLETLLDPVVLGIVAGLFLGKQIGIFSMIVIARLLNIAPLPRGVNWWQIYAVSLLCGIGFTMSLFIGNLAYDGVEMQMAVRLGVIIGSLLSAVAGYMMLRWCCNKRDENAAIAEH